MIEEIINDYISLQEAAKHCNYSQEYLSLRARQKKLKAIKLGRNWVTKKEWLDEYLNRAKSPKEQLIDDPKKEKIVEPGKLPLLQEIKPSIILQLPQPKIDYPTFVLEREELGAEALSPELLKTPKPRVLIPRVRLGLIFSLAIILPLLISVFFALRPRDLKDFSVWLNTNIKTSFLTIKISTDKQISKIKNNYLSLNNVIKKKLNQEYQLVVQYWKSQKEKIMSRSTKEGLVVIPSSGKDEEVKRKIKESFSDEVKVEPKDETSGVIIPVFRQKEGEKYLYILVPMQN